MATLVGWFVYDWKLGLMVTIMAGFVALFYSAALPNLAGAKVKKTFAWVVIAMSLIAIGVVNQTDRGTEDSPRMCGRVEC